MELNEHYLLAPFLTISQKNIITINNKTKENKSYGALGWVAKINYISDGVK
jgi:hypothetical protein